MSHIDLNQYFAPKERKTSRPEYDREALFKLVLFAFMEFGYCSVRQLRHNDLARSLDDIFTEINACIFEKEHVDTNHIYIDGTKLKANAGNYTWVWKKSCIKNRNNVFAKVTESLVRINEIVRSVQGAEFEIFPRIQC